MPATVVVGTQWGDEGKGKLTDLLAGEMDLVVRYQGGHNAGHTHRGRRRDLRPPAGARAASSTPTSPRSSATAWWSTPACCWTRSTTWPRRGVDTSRLVVSGNAHLIMPYHQELDRVTERYLGQERPGHHQAGHRPGLRRQGGPGRAAGPGPARPQDLPPEARRGPEGEERRPGQGLQPPAAVGRRHRRALPRRVRPPARADGRRHRRAGPRRAGGRAQRAAGGRPGHLPRPRPRHLSVRHLVQPGGRRRLHRDRPGPAPHRPGHRHRQGLRDPGGGRALPDRAPRRRWATCWSSGATSSAPTPAGAAAAAGSTP